MAEADGRRGEGQRLILVAVDGGEESMHALSWCLKNIVSKLDTLVLLYSKPPGVAYQAMDAQGYLLSSDMITSMERYGQQMADSVMEKAVKICHELQTEGIKVERRAEHGDPREVICEVAEKIRPDLLVMGSHGYGIIKRALLGSVSSHCAQNVKCPVLIVKKPKH